MIAVVMCYAAAERALGRGDGAGRAADRSRRPARKARARPLKHDFDDVVVVLAVEVLDVQRHAGRLREGLEPLLEQLGVHLAELRPGESHLPDQIRPVRSVEADPVSVSSIGIIAHAVALDAGAVAQRLRHRLADDVAGVLGGVVEIDVQVALGVQR